MSAPNKHSARGTKSTQGTTATAATICRVTKGTDMSDMHTALVEDVVAMWTAQAEAQGQRHRGLGRHCNRPCGQQRHRARGTEAWAGTTGLGRHYWPGTLQAGHTPLWNTWLRRLEVHCSLVSHPPVRLYTACTLRTGGQQGLTLLQDIIHADLL